MTLHISVNSKDTELKYMVLDYLSEFYRKKTYAVATCKILNEPQLQYILNCPDLNVYSKLLFKAYYRTQKFLSTDFTDYRVVFWDSSFIDDFINQDTYSLSYIKALNRHSLIYDLYLTYDYSIDLKTNKLNHYNIKSNERGMENTIKAIFDSLPRCNWCGKIFKPSQEHKTYCTKDCAKASLEEQNRENNRNYHKRYKNVLSEREKGALGSKNANLHANSPNLDNESPDFFKELETIRKAKKSIGL